MKVLLDTNIFIDRENDTIVPKQIQDLLKLINQHGAQILIHPLSKEEIKSDRNQTRRRVVGTKIQTYASLIDARASRDNEKQRKEYQTIPRLWDGGWAGRAFTEILFF